MAILSKIIRAATDRLVLDGTGEREIVESALRKLPRVAYRRLCDQGFSPGGIIDVGACEGDWTRAVREVFPSRPILMIEARKEQEHPLRQVCSAIPGVDYMLHRKAYHFILVVLDHQYLQKEVTQQEDSTDYKCTHLMKSCPGGTQNVRICF